MRRLQRIRQDERTSSTPVPDKSSQPSLNMLQEAFEEAGAAHHVAHSSLIYDVQNFCQLPPKYSVS
jgi:hypothetical protein